MFDFVQEKKRVVQIVLALIVLPFALWGVDSYQKFGGPEPLARVNGEKIGQQEFDNAMEQQRKRMREMAGANFDMTFFDKPEIKHSVLEGLVTQRVLQAEAKKANLMLGDEQLAQVIASIGAFHKDGKFDRQRYEAALSERGMNRLEFEARLRRDVATRQLTDAYTQSGFASNTVTENLIRLNEQQRVVAVANLNQETFLKQVQVNDADVKAYYEKNTNEFQLSERASVEFVTFSLDSLLPAISVAEDEIKKYYEEHAADFTTQEQRQAAHILIAVAKQASDAEKQTAKAKAEQVLQQVKQSPDKFAALAKQYSQDSGSATKGGDLGMFGRGAMVKPFEDSVFGLKAGEVSDLVQSDFGFHIIKLVAIKPPKAQAESEVHTLIVQRLKTQRASDKFAELAEKFNNAVYEQSDTLKPAAELVKESVQQGVWLSKGQAPNGFWTDKVLQAVFSEDVLKNKRNTVAIEVGENVLLAARVVEYKPASTRPFDEVAPAILQKLQRQQAAELVAQQGKELLERLQRGEKASVNWNAAQTVSRSQHSTVEPALLQAVFHAEPGKLPAYVGVMSSQGGYVLARIDAVKELGVIEEGRRNDYAQQIRQLTGEELLHAYLSEARKHSEITMKEFSTDENEKK